MYFSLNAKQEKSFCFSCLFVVNDTVESSNAIIIFGLKGNGYYVVV